MAEADPKRSGSPTGPSSGNDRSGSDRGRGERLRSPALPDADVHAEIFRRIRDAHMLELAEDYVELIADLIEAKGEARLVEVAQRLGVTKAAASTTINKLKRDGLIVSEKYRALFLTDSGQELANRSKLRHDIVYKFLLKLGVREETAYFDSEGMEHHISPETLEFMRRFADERDD